MTNNTNFLVILLVSLNFLWLSRCLQQTCFDDAYTVCGTSADQSTFDQTKACSSSCCSALSSASASCNGSLLFDSFNVQLVSYQIKNCPNSFSCLPNNKCFDSSDLVSKNRGALVLALSTCGISLSVNQLVNLDNNKIDSAGACTQSCCQALDMAWGYCKDNDGYNVVNRLVPLFQSFRCGSFSCTMNNCFASEGLINPSLGALNRAIATCGLPASIQSISQIASNSMSFSSTQACSVVCCNALTQAKNYCNSSSDLELYDVVDTFLTGYQLLQCSDGFTCVPNDKCWDDQGLVNGERGALNRALKRCGLPLDLKRLTVEAKDLVSNLEAACSPVCCQAIENAASFCTNNSENSQDYDTFKKLMYAYQALKCDNFTCKPRECFDPYGLINSNIGAANRVLRYCGAPIDVKSLVSSSTFDAKLSCTPRCCSEVNDAKPFCNTSTEFRVFLEAFYAFQAGYCKPTFLCRPNDQCFDHLGLINYQIGALNRALGECGTATSINSIEEIANGLGMEEKACNKSCCDYLIKAEDTCGSYNPGVLAFKTILYPYQAGTCQDGFTCERHVHCYDKLAVINAEVSPLSKAMKVCGSTSLRDFSLDIDKACQMSCCEAMLNASSAPSCTDSDTFRSFEAGLLALQTLYCVNPPFVCNATRSDFHVFGLTVGKSVIVVGALSLFVLIVLLVLWIVLCCWCRYKCKEKEEDSDSFKMM